MGGSNANLDVITNKSHFIHLNELLVGRPVQADVLIATAVVGVGQWQREREINQRHNSVMLNIPTSRTTGDVIIMMQHLATISTYTHTPQQNLHLINTNNTYARISCLP